MKKSKTRIGILTALILSLFSLVFIFSGCEKSDQQSSRTRGIKSSSLVQELSAEEYRELIFDYTAGKPFLSKNDKPVIIDFYAVWCGPCKMMAPVLDKLSLDYEGDVQFYKVDAEKVRVLSSLHGIQAFPTLHFIPARASSQQIKEEKGYKAEAELIKLIDENF